MDCSICSSYPVIIRPPRNTICGSCSEGIKTAFSLMGSFEGGDDHEAETAGLESNHRNPKSMVSPTTKSKGLADLIEWMKRTKKVEDELSQKISFLAGSLVSAFQEQIHTDLKIKPSNGPPISAHRAILAARSQIFKNMLDSDSCKSSPSDTVTIPELTHEELESLLEFLYRGSLAPEKMDKHIYSLMLASHKYEIPYLQESCQRRMLENLNASNALVILEILDVCSHQKLKDIALGFVVKNIDDIAFSAKYEAFCSKNPHLSVQITRASLIDARDRRRT
ncbi:BTB/POZ domain-containing protein At3g56230-like [Rhodamnia argentea]|uniref:BTB/POZ domain-containing protein At3g56230-like n=1 Tax=Rhodamnia argentea TaxID=178133 RepID=A0A8B8Q1C7_9MYRT|nr:BTB/POZ domain-containing protein At3g56230-like [Rhodamnia argentea]